MIAPASAQSLTGEVYQTATGGDLYSFQNYYFNNIYKPDGTLTLGAVRKPLIRKGL